MFWHNKVGSLPN